MFCCCVRAQLQQTCIGARSRRVHLALSVCRYKEFKAALESLDPKRQSHSPLPIIYQWQAPIAGAGTKCARPPLLGHSRRPAPRMWNSFHGRHIGAVDLSVLAAAHHW